MTKKSYEILCVVLCVPSTGEHIVVQRFFQNSRKCNSKEKTIDLNATKQDNPYEQRSVGREKWTVPIKPGKPPNWKKLLSNMMVTNPLVTRSSLATTTSPNPIRMCCQGFEQEHFPGQLPFSQIPAVLFASDKKTRSKHPKSNKYKCK